MRKSRLVTTLFLCALVGFMKNSSGQVKAELESARVQKKKTYQLWYDAPAPNRGGNYKALGVTSKPYDADWESLSLPLGNGWLGACVFGRTDTERIQITENTLVNKSLHKLGGLTNFAEIYLGLGRLHPSLTQTVHSDNTMRSSRLGRGTNEKTDLLFALHYRCSCYRADEPLSAYQLVPRRPNRNGLHC